VQRDLVAAREEVLDDSLADEERAAEHQDPHPSRGSAARCAAPGWWRPGPREC
jgi:hypothetical protein